MQGYATKGGREGERMGADKEKGKIVKTLWSK